MYKIISEETVLQRKSKICKKLYKKIFSDRLLRHIYRLDYTQTDYKTPNSNIIEKKNNHKNKSRFNGYHWIGFFYGKIFSIRTTPLLTNKVRQTTKKKKTVTEMIY